MKTVLVLSADPVVRAGLTRLERDGRCSLRFPPVSGEAMLARAPAVPLVSGQSEDDRSNLEEPTAVVIDLDDDEALLVVRQWREGPGRVLIAGHFAAPDRARWSAAERAGCDLVATRGSVALQLRAKLATFDAATRRIVLVDLREVAGRLGLVRRLEDSPVGPIACYNLGWTLACVSDLCPHAGASLSEGEVVEGVVTCPRHGSQFDLRSGDRIRGPADLGLVSYRIVEEEGRALLILPA